MSTGKFIQVSLNNKFICPMCDSHVCKKCFEIKEIETKCLTVNQNLVMNIIILMLKKVLKASN